MQCIMQCVSFSKCVGPFMSCIMRMKLAWSVSNLFDILWVELHARIDARDFAWSVWWRFMSGISFLQFLSAVKVASLWTRLINEWRYKHKYMKTFICNYFKIFYKYIQYFIFFEYFINVCRSNIYMLYNILYYKLN